MGKPRRVHVFLCDPSDNMYARTYYVMPDGSVVRWCHPRGGTFASVRQRIPRVQCAREMAALYRLGFVHMRGY
jgi:hypothetical protein